jgi:hypothetical protein
MEGLDALKERVDALLKSYTSLLRERNALKKELAAKDVENKALAERLRAAEDELLALQIGKAIPDNASRNRNRKKLDAVIGQIDKILTALND